MAKKFNMLFHEISERRDLTPLAKVIDSYLTSRTGNNGYCWPGLQTIMRDCGCHRNGALSAIRQLEQAGLWVVERRQSVKSCQSNQYRPGPNHPLSTDAQNALVPNAHQHTNGTCAQNGDGLVHKAHPNQNIESEQTYTYARQNGDVERAAATESAYASDGAGGATRRFGRLPFPKSSTNEKPKGASRIESVMRPRIGGGTVTYHGQPVLRDDIERELRRLMEGMEPTDRDRHEVLDLIRRAGGETKGQKRVLAAMLDADPWGEAAAAVRTIVGGKGFAKGKKAGREAAANSKKPECY